MALVSIPQPNDFATRQETSFRYADGSTQIAHVGVNRDSVPIEAIPLVVQHSVLAAEDRGFYTESGVSPTGILRAVKDNLTAGGGNPQGGSTITQQYVKNYYLTQQQTIGRKIREALIAVKTDQTESKDTILQNYLNTIYFGRNSYGIETASRAYFGVPVAALADDPAKAAYLAALIQSPYYFSTADADPEAAQRLVQRWNYVLDGMVQQHWLAAADRARLTFPRPVPYRSNDLAGPNGYAVNAAMRDLDRLHEQNPDVPDSTAVSRGGYTVVTTFRPEYMRAAEQAVARSMATLDPAGNPGDRDVHVGLAAVDSATGAVLGFYGGPDFVTQPFNDAMQAAGPLGARVGGPLLRAAIGAAKAAAVRDDTRTTLTAVLAEHGLRTIGSSGEPISGETVAATPTAAAALFAGALFSGSYSYHRPYTVAAVLQDGQVLWQADESAVRASAGAVRGPAGPTLAGMDGAEQWAWTLTGRGRVAVAANMYATVPGGQRNRRLDGVTAAIATTGTADVPVPGPNAQERIERIARDFLVGLAGTPAADPRASGERLPAVTPSATAPEPRTATGPGR
ncbi:hypothetical protein GTS_44100 [Gandjariella thermophila]|uniref:Glycosyl transferase family 51 domain-containing protein n=1 Tax=Gandjariella thermophila TaxID=1931992 RepID=A0A4D4JFW0_9PSEU|nr:hypothetical protein GTS_44100 [Gandjariella thermophila]